MPDLLLKAHGADAKAMIACEPNGPMVASFAVTNAGVAQVRGPQAFGSIEEASRWIVEQASFHGFDDGDFEIKVTRDDA